MDVQNATFTIDTILSNENKTLIVCIDFIYTIYKQYRVDLNYVTEDDLTDLSVLKDSTKQMSKEE